MNRKLFAAVTMSIILALSGCGGGSSSPPPVFMTQILSNPAFDGDIRFDPPNSFTITQGNIASVFAGVDPVTGSEYRAFLDFSLNGVPVNAIIDSATLDIFIGSRSNLPVASFIPIRIELVSFSPPTLLPSYYDQPLLAARTNIPISRNDIGRHVSVDVTSLMVEAQRRRLVNFQIRILEDFGFVLSGLVEIDDSTINRAPLLTVTYF